MANTISQSEAIPVPATGLRPGVAEALEHVPPPKANVAQGLAILVFTLALFSLGAGAVGWEATELAVIAAVVLLHEAGHFVAMRAFGYRDVRVFFIPFFGAATSGRAATVSGAQRAIVSLAGPLPGLFVGLIMLSMLGPQSSDFMFTAAFMLVAVNGFNLLPFKPLDGGQLMGLLVFSRHPVLELLFQIVAAAGLGVMAWLTEDWILGVVGGVTLITAPILWKTSSAAAELGRRLPADVPNQEAIPESLQPTVADVVTERIEDGLPKPLEAKSFASWMTILWRRARLRPPSAGPAALLLLVYLAAIGITLAVVWPFIEVLL